MDGGDLWNSRLSSSSSSSSLSRRYQLRSEALLGDDFIVEDEYRQEFSCPYCAEEFDIVGLVCHIDEEHQVEVKHGLCPICAKKVGVEMVGHVTMQHGTILKRLIKYPAHRKVHASSQYPFYNLTGPSHVADMPAPSQPEWGGKEKHFCNRSTTMCNSGFSCILEGQDLCEYFVEMGRGFFPILSEIRYYRGSLTKRSRTTQEEIA